jgi:hypothetical protein
VKSDESQYSAPTPEEGKALIYFVADGRVPHGELRQSHEYTSIRVDTDGRRFVPDSTTAKRTFAG